MIIKFIGMQLNIDSWSIFLNEFQEFLAICGIIIGFIESANIGTISGKTYHDKPATYDLDIFDHHFKNRSGYRFFITMNTCHEKSGGIELPNTLKNISSLTLISTYQDFNLFTLPLLNSFYDKYRFNLKEKNASYNRERYLIGQRTGLAFVRDRRYGFLLHSQRVPGFPEEDR